MVAALDEKCTLPSDSVISAVHISESSFNKFDFSDLLSPTLCEAVSSFVGRDMSLDLTLRRQSVSA